MSQSAEEKIKQMSAHIEQFKQMSHRAKDRVERLAALSMEIEDELRMRSFADRVSELFDISSDFETKIESLIDDYSMERNRVKQASDS